MKEELQTALVELIQKTLQGVDATKDFLTAGIPDVIHQLLMWHGVYNFILFCIGIFLLILMIWLNIKQYKFWENYPEEKISKLPDFFTNYTKTSIDYIIVAVLNLLQFLPIILISHLINFQWLQIWIAPKVWLIEYMGNLIK